MIAGDSAVARDSDREFSRRELLSKAAAVGGAAALVGGSGLVAAGRGRAASTGASGAAAAGARRGGTLVLGQLSPPEGFDPALFWEEVAFTSDFAVFDRLFTVSSDGKRLLPQLLASMPTVSRNGTLYTYKLRKGIRFHHGRELTADDVKFTIERLVNPATKSQGASLYQPLPIKGMAAVINQKAKTLLGIKVVDKHTFTIALDHPENALNYVLSFAIASIVPRDVVEKLGDKFKWGPVGTGPFKMTSVNPNKGVRLVRNTAYWQRGVPYLDGVTWNFGIDPQLSVLRIQQGQQDMMMEGIAPGQLTQIMGDSKLRKQLITGLQNTCFYLTLPVSDPRLKDVRVRQAIAMAIDKTRYIRTINGLGIPATGGIFAPASPYYQPGIAPPHNPAKAKQLLAAAGLSSGFSIPFWGRAATPYLEEGQTIQQDLATIGITVDLHQPDETVRLQYVTQIPKPNAIMENEWTLWYPLGSYVTDPSFTSAAMKASCCNFSNWSDPHYDALAREAHLTTNLARVTALYKQLDRIVVKNEVVWVPMIYPKHAEFVSARTRGFVVSTSTNPAVKFLRDYWLA